MPVAYGPVVLEVGERDARPARKAPFQPASFGAPPAPTESVTALVPEAALVADLDQGAAEEHRAEMAVGDVANRFDEQRPGLPAAGGAAVDGDVRLTSKKGIRGPFCGRIVPALSTAVVRQLEDDDRRRRGGGIEDRLQRLVLVGLAR